MQDNGKVLIQLPLMQNNGFPCMQNNSICQSYLVRTVKSPSHIYSSFPCHVKLDSLSHGQSSRTMHDSDYVMAYSSQNCQVTQSYLLFIPMLCQMSHGQSSLTCLTMCDSDYVMSDFQTYLSDYFIWCCFGTSTVLYQSSSPLFELVCSHN